MDQFEIRCTPQQTQKALQLGAPIIKVDTRDKRLIYGSNMCYPRTEADYPYAIPTAEEMIGWLGEQGIQVDVCYESENRFYYVFDFDDFISDFFSTRKEATIAAIDAALAHLSNKKK